MSDQLLRGRAHALIDTLGGTPCPGDVHGPGCIAILEALQAAFRDGEAKGFDAAASITRSHCHPIVFQGGVRELAALLAAAFEAHADGRRAHKGESG